MIYAKLEKNTKHFQYNGKMYCSYCGEVIEPDTEIDHYVRIDFYHCNCHDAKMEMSIAKDIEDMHKKINAIKKTFPTAKYDENNPKGDKWGIDTIASQVYPIKSIPLNNKAIIFDTREDAEGALAAIIKYKNKIYESER